MLEKILHQLIQLVSLHLTDTIEFLGKLKEFWDTHDVTDNTIFFSVDVVNLYGSIPLDRAIGAVREALEVHSQDIDMGGLSIDDICGLLEQCLTTGGSRGGGQRGHAPPKAPKLSFFPLKTPNESHVWRLIKENGKNKEISTLP